MKPHKLILFGILVAVPSLLLLSFYPDTGIRLFGNTRLVFPGFAETFSPGSDSTTHRIAAILDENAVDKSATPDEQRRLDSLRTTKTRDSVRRGQLKIHYPPGLDTLLYPFFRKLDRIDSLDGPLHIFHFGDSQIEGDRITDFLRYKLQSQYGGTGPGWLPAVPYVGSRSFFIENSESWVRYAIYGLQDSTVSYDRYGPLGLFGRFTHFPDSFMTNTSITQATILYQARASAYTPVKTFRNVRLFYGKNTDPFIFRIKRGTHHFVVDTLAPTEAMKVACYTLNRVSRSVVLEFEGSVSPDIYAVSLEGEYGLIVSNVAMRGQSGTSFRAVPAEQWRKAFEEPKPGLILLQFGGNSVPYVETEQDVREYADYFRMNIQFLSRLSGQTPIIVIGPADMAVKEGAKWKTYPMHGTIRNALKQAAFKAGAAYWDPFTAMGGEGAINQWVNTDPPLALPDHIHFTIEGGEVIAQWIYDALMREYNSWQNRQAFAPFSLPYHQKENEIQ